MTASGSDAWVVDSVEDGIAKLEGPDGGFVHLPAAWLPADAGEGSWIRISLSNPRKGGRSITLRVDAAATERSSAEMEAQVKRLEARDPGGDLTL